MAEVRFVSEANTTFFRDNSTTTYDTDDKAVLVASPNNLWPKIINDSDPQPQYIWYQSSVNPTKAATGEIMYFGRELNVDVQGNLPANYPLALHVAIVADNAFKARVTFGFDSSFMSFDLSDGNIDPVTGLVEVGFPYNWQKIYELEEVVVLGPSVGAFNIQFEAKVVNYEQTNGTPESNPAGFMYVVRVMNIPKIDSVTEVTPPVMSNPLDSV